MDKKNTLFFYLFKTVFFLMFFIMLKKTVFFLLINVFFKYNLKLTLRNNMYKNNILLEKKQLRFSQRIKKTLNNNIQVLITPKNYQDFLLFPIQCSSDDQRMKLSTSSPLTFTQASQIRVTLGM